MYVYIPHIIFNVDRCYLASDNSRKSQKMNLFMKKKKAERATNQQNMAGIQCGDLGLRGNRTT